MQKFRPNLILNFQIISSCRLRFIKLVLLYYYLVGRVIEHIVILLTGLVVNMFKLLYIHIFLGLIIFFEPNSAMVPPMHRSVLFNKYPQSVFSFLSFFTFHFLTQPYNEVEQPCFHIIQ